MLDYRISAVCCACFVLCGSLLAGCETPAEARTADSVAPGPDFVEHRGSGIRFPETLAGFRRGELNVYDEDGEDQSFAYDRVTLLEVIALTLYVYPAPALVSIGSPDSARESALRRQIDLQFESAVEPFLGRNSQATLLVDQSRELPFCGTRLPGRGALYRTPNRSVFPGVTAISRFELYRDGEWWIKLRATYPESMAERADRSISKLVEALDLANRSSE